jgi:hypothetical protein
MILNISYEEPSKNKNIIGYDGKTSSGGDVFHASPLITVIQAICDAKKYRYYYHPREIVYNIRTPAETVSLRNYIIPVGVSHSPEDWLVDGLFKNLNDIYLQDLRTGKALLVVDQSLEGYHRDYIWEFFHSKCAEYYIHPKQIFYITGNLATNFHYHSWCLKNNVSYENRLRTVGYPHFEQVVYFDSLKRNQSDSPLPTFEDHLRYKSIDINNIKTYACLNKRQRPHRVWMFVHLMEKDLLTKGLVSMNDYGRHVHTWEGKNLTQDQIEFSTKLLPMKVYDKPNNSENDIFYIHRFNDDVCLDTFFSVIPEAACGDEEKSIFLSEKTFKPICCSTPFAIWGGKNSMRELQKLGYKTFHPFIDETYDDRPTWSRLDSLTDTIKKIDNIKNKMKWFMGMEDIIKHNLRQIEINTTRKEPPAFLELEKYCIQLFKD